MPDIALNLSGCRVLVVEDEYFIAWDMEQTLRRAGAAVAGPVSDAQQALALIANSQLDAAVLDVNLKRVAAYEVADQLSARNIPYLFATGEVQIVDRSDYRSRPKLEKPVLGDELLLTIDKLVGSRGAKFGQ